MYKFEGKSLNQIYAPVPTDTKDILLLFVEFVFNWIMAIEIETNASKNSFPFLVSFTLKCTN